MQRWYLFPRCVVFCDSTASKYDLIVSILWTLGRQTTGMSRNNKRNRWYKTNCWTHFFFWYRFGKSWQIKSQWSNAFNPRKLLKIIWIESEWRLIFERLNSFNFSGYKLRKSAYTLQIKMLQNLRIKLCWKLMMFFRCNWEYSHPKATQSKVFLCYIQVTKDKVW